MNPEVEALVAKLIDASKTFVTAVAKRDEVLIEASDKCIQSLSRKWHLGDV